MLIIGRMKPSEVPFVDEYSKQVDITPWQHAKKVGFLITVIVILVYVYFS